MKPGKRRHGGGEAEVAAAAEMMTSSVTTARVYYYYYQYLSKQLSIEKFIAKLVVREKECEGWVNHLTNSSNSCIFYREAKQEQQQQQKNREGYVSLYCKRTSF